jgi:uncharacterized membrane-anchored protein YhcB (DUF1043 family)
MKKLAIILAVVFGLGILTLGSCAALLAKGTSEVSNEVDRQNQKLNDEVKRQQEELNREVQRQQEELNKELQRQQDELRKQLAPVAPTVEPELPTATEVPSAQPGNPPMYGATHSCRALKDMGLSFETVTEYWVYLDSPADMDDDSDGIPCETVYGQR